MQPRVAHPGPHDPPRQRPDCSAPPRSWGPTQPGTGKNMENHEKHEGSVTQSAEVIGYKLSSHKPMPYRQYDKYIQIYTV